MDKKQKRDVVDAWREMLSKMAPVLSNEMSDDAVLDMAKLFDEVAVQMVRAAAQAAAGSVEDFFRIQSLYAEAVMLNEYRPRGYVEGAEAEAETSESSGDEDMIEAMSKLDASDADWLRSLM